ncbi:uncharacterized protein LY89DRAFT_200651 [Mollisia scopiformis]|uniref:Uncharacterized protein n=1 Tax=Mollisia scopiformis TaxID=149040 RepID=A0A194WYR2_MOLSC|nr:uncharacterized protein LY89DRAFT_200651 [Mollisia scopiformis]KUJ13085.1 hypothetical protein LY89DRAFT_200651 [Mollisia scopiformis]
MNTTPSQASSSLLPHTYALWTTTCSSFSLSRRSCFYYLRLSILGAIASIEPSYALVSVSLSSPLLSPTRKIPFLPQSPSSQPNSIPAKLDLLIQPITAHCYCAPHSSNPSPSHPGATSWPAFSTHGAHGGKNPNAQSDRGTTPTHHHQPQCRTLNSVTPPSRILVAGITSASASASASARDPRC